MLKSIIAVGCAVAFATVVYAADNLPAGAPSQSDAEGAPCAPLHDRLEFLKRKYGEVPAFTGMSLQGGRTVVLTVNPQGTSWSILGTDRDGKLCILDAGSVWKMAPQGQAI